uniref:Uncharacterized protein n=1 Tax=viral metagenome TaxID=1070528 RepID=A0A6C0HZ69_9ZZZZ
MFPKKFIIRNKVFLAVALFLGLFTIFHSLKPAFAYDENGAFRQFGIGYRHKTVIPIWLIAIIVAIISYLATLAYIKLL